MVRALCLIKNWHDLAHDLAHQFNSWNRSFLRKNVIDIGNRKNSPSKYFFLLKLIKLSPCRNESTSSHGLYSTLTVWTIEIVLNYFSKIFNKIGRNNSSMHEHGANYLNCFENLARYFDHIFLFFNPQKKIQK